MTQTQKFDPKNIQSQVQDRLNIGDIQAAINDSKRESIMFIEGPPTLNGSPHAGHLRGRIIKDLWYRYMTLTGKRVIFCGGWDTQGLPIELQAEKELGVTGGKAEIVQNVGVERLVDACKSIVKKYNKKWEKTDHMIGLCMDHTKSYWTYLDPYIEREWQVLRRAKESGILEDDHTVIGYCPGCQTSLSHAEVNQGYDTVIDPSLYYKVRLQEEDLYLVVWTTMPFTIVTDAMVGLHPDTEYAIIKVGNERWVVAKDRLEGFVQEAEIDEYTIESIIMGTNLEGKKYIHPLLDKIPALSRLADGPKYHTAVAESFVDASTGSGLVHLAPANGEEDIAIAKRRGVEVFCPIDDSVRFTADAGEYAGMFVRDADETVIEDLRRTGSVIKAGRITHKYPLCWRSKHPIVWLARRGWFYKLDRLGDRTLRAAQNVKYYFKAPKNRFLAIVGERHPWCISRERYWGCPLPVWHCADCGHKTWCYSRDDIIKCAHTLPDGEKFELHRPWIDRIVIRCEKCASANTEREQYVLDTWHNSGAAPYASLEQNVYEDTIPAPFFTEGIDQTRGWAYTLLVENVILSGKAMAPYGSFLFQGHVLDEKGGKMSKSLGNVIDAQELLEANPADLIRLYFMWKSSPVEPLNFSVSEMYTRPYQILNTIYNMHLHYIQNSRYDKYTDKKDIKWAKQKNLLREPEMWLLSKMQSAIKVVTERIQKCKFHEAARAIDDFAINALSQTYMQSVRTELWDDDKARQDRRHAIYATISAALRCIDIIIHPFCPFTTEYLYKMLFGQKKSILLEEWPRVDESLVDHNLEEEFGSLRSLLSVAASARAQARLKRRWTLQEAIVTVPADKAGVEHLKPYLMQQMNVKKLIGPIPTKAQSDFERIYEMVKLDMPIKPIIELDRKRVGPRAKQAMPKLVKELKKTNPGSIIESIKAGRCAMSIDGIEFVLTPADFVVGMKPADQYQMASRDGYTVFISTARNDATVSQWFLRDVARRIQNLRKERGYDPTQILDAAYVLNLDEPIQQSIKSKEFDLAKTVRVKKILFDRNPEVSYKDVDIDGQRIQIAVI